MTACTSLLFQENVFIAAEECMEEAFKTIRQHFLLCKKSFVNKEELIKKLEERNTRLTKAVELLQRENVTNKRSFSNENNNDVEEDNDAVQCQAYESEKHQKKGACPADDLNVAFDNEQMFNSSIDANECVIAETEPLPRVETITKDPHKSIIKKNNIQPLGNISNLDSKSEQDHQIVIKNGTSIRNTNGNNCPKFMSPNTRKLRQTRLQFNSTYYNNKVNEKKLKKTVLEEIDGSPSNENLTKLRHGKNNRSWTHSWNRKNTQILFEDDTDCDDDSDFADNSPKKVIIHKKQKTNLGKELDISHIAVPKVDCQHNQLVEPSTSQSVMLVSPEPPEIVFLDDSTTEDEGDTTQLKTMDLLKFDCTFLERAENNCIKNAKNQNYDVVIDKDDNKWLRPLPVKMKQEPQTSNKSINEIQGTKNENVLAESTENRNKSFLNKLDENWQVLNKEDLDAFTKMEEEVEEFYHRPISIKEEKSPVLEKPLHHIDMDMSSMDDMQSTPENFWNPFLESFKEDDPRREVLRDPRLANKKK